MMKKLLALLLSVLMLTSVLTACSSDEPETDGGDQTVTDGETDQTGDENADENGGTEADQPTDDADEPAAGDGEQPSPEAEQPEEQPMGDAELNQPAADPNAPVEDDAMNQPAADPNAPVAPDAGADTPAGPAEPGAPAVPAPDASAGTLEDVISAVYGVQNPGLGSLASMPVDIADADALRYYTGLSDGSKVAEAVVSEPMMSSQAYSLVVVRVNDPADAESVAQEIMAGVDPWKWLCVGAEDMSAAVSGDLVLFVMIDDMFENMDAVDLTNAFVSLYGGSVVQ